MTSVLIALADVGPGVQLEEQLVKVGLPARWDASVLDSARGSPTVVVLDADVLGRRLQAVADAWRALPAVPGLVALGSEASLEPEGALMESWRKV